MKLYKRFFCLLLSLILLPFLPGKVSATGIVAEGTDGREITWVLTNDGTLTVSGSGEVGEPYWESGTPPKSSWWQYRNQIRTVVIQEGISAVGNVTFSGCVNLEEVFLPASLEFIEWYALSNYPCLKGIWVSENNSSFYSCTRGALYSKDEGSGEYTLLALPATLTGDYYLDERTSEIYAILSNVSSLNSIVANPESPYFSNCAQGALYSKDYTTLLYVPRTLTGDFHVDIRTKSLEEYAFIGCRNLKNIFITENVRSISSSFSGCSSLEGIRVNPNNPYFYSCNLGVLYSRSELLAAPRTLSGHYELPEKISYIASAAFSGCSGLTSISLNNVEEIHSSAFYNCSGLEEISIPASVYYIYEDAFIGCSSLTAIHVDESNTEYSSRDGFLFNKDQTELLVAPGGFSGSYEIPKGVLKVSGPVFYGCAKLTELHVPNSVFIFTDDLLVDCTSLSSIIFYGSKPLMDFRTQEGKDRVEYSLLCSNVTATCYYPAEYSSWGNIQANFGGDLTWVATQGLVPEPTGELIASGECGSNLTWTLTDYGDLVISGEGEMDDFFDYTYLGEIALAQPWINYVELIKNVELADGITTIGQNAFLNCRNLKSITIPKGIEEIYSYGSSGLTEFIVDEENANYSSKSGCLLNKEGTLLIVVPKGKTGSLWIPESVREVEYNAFYGMKTLEEIVFWGDCLLGVDEYDGEHYCNTDFYGVKATCYYPANNPTWTEEILSAYSEEYGLTWIAMEELAPGDADGNGVANYSDALTVLRSSIGLEEVAPNVVAACDMNSDGQLNYSDALIILRRSIGLE